MNDNPFTILIEEPVPGSRLRVVDVVAAGRRRVARGRAALVTAAAATVLAVVVGVAAIAAQRPHRLVPIGPIPAPTTRTPSATAPTGCTVTRLSGPADLRTTPEVHLDPTGRYAAVSLADRSGLVRWDGTTFAGVVKGGNQFDVAAVNADGVVVGSGQRNGHAVAYLAADGVVVELHLPGGTVGARALAINSGGDIVGEATTAGGRAKAVLWRRADPVRPQFLATPTDGQSSAHGIADDGRIVGDLDNGAEPYLWKADGSGVRLPTPPGLASGIALDLIGDWADGPVATSAIPATGRPPDDGQPHWVRWNLAAGADRTGVTVETIDMGRILGAHVTRDGTVLVNRPTGVVLWHNGGITELPQLDGYDNPQGYGVSADGRTVVGATVPISGGTPVPIRWNC